MIVSSNTRRPRNVDVPRAAAILYGDWGTSKAYVIGLAFAVGGYSSFWLIAAMCILTALVGVNYMTICRHYPDGGGVYASVRHRSEMISIIGAFLLIADYIVTAALSALSAFDYFQFSHANWWAAGAILCIGGLNLFGPKHTGGLAFLVAIPTAIIVVVLGLFSLPHLGHALHNLQPLHGSFGSNWTGFVGVVLALSGVEAIANSTGVMKLNPGSTDAKPCVSKTSTPAILWVMVEVCLFTALLSFAVHGLDGLVINGDNVDAPGHPGVRDYMLRYLGETYIGGLFHAVIVGKVVGVVIAVVFGFLLLSAVNTAIVDLVAISYLMSRDSELPPHFQKLNQFGVPNLGVIIATIVPALLVICVKDMDALADLYAVGVVGAIATNLGASSTDRKLDLAKWERILMFFTFLVMVSIELSLIVTKPTARVFAAEVLVLGLIMRGLAAEYNRNKKAAAAKAAAATDTAVHAAAAASFPISHVELSEAPIMCAVRGPGKTLDFALEQARKTEAPLYLLFVRPKPALTEADYKTKWQEDPQARETFLYAKSKSNGHPVFPCYAVSDSVADTIVDITATMGASHLILGAPNRRGLAGMLRGDIIGDISDSLPDDIHLLVYA